VIYYIILFIILFYYSLKYEILYKEKRSGKKAILFFIIFIFAFSYQMGTDWINYQNFYEYEIPHIKLEDLYNNSKFVFSSEKAFVLLNMFFYNLGFSYELFTGIVIGFCLFFILKSIEQRSDNFYFSFFLSIVIFLFGYSLEPVFRQLIALTLIVIGFKYIERRNFFKYLFVIILATQFHISAFIALPIYFLEKIDFSKKKFCLLFFGSYIIILLRSKIFLVLIKISSKFLRYESYFLSNRYGLSVERSFLGEIYSVGIFIVYTYIIFYSYEFSKNKKNYLKNMSLIYIVLNYFANIFPILFRVSHYFVIGFIVSMSSLKFIRTPNKKILKLGKRSISYILIIFLYIPFILDAWREIYGTKLNIYRYGNYKNYFVEMVNGRLKNNFYEKSEEYRKNIENFLNEEDKEREESIFILVLVDGSCSHFRNHF